MKKTTQSITIRQLGIDIHYLDMSEEVRHFMCVEILKNALQKTSRESMKALLQNSLEYNESVELFENCQIFKELQDTLEKEFKI